MVVASNCFASSAWRSFTRCHNSSSTIRRHLGPDPPGLGVRARHTLTGVRVFDEALPVPDQHAGIKLVVDDAVAPAGVTPDRRPQVWPNGPGMLSRFRSVAMARGDFPTANSRKMRRTTAASASLILRSPLPARLRCRCASPRRSHSRAHRLPCLSPPVRANHDGSWRQGLSGTEHSSCL